MGVRTEGQDRQRVSHVLAALCLDLRAQVDLLLRKHAGNGLKEGPFPLNRRQLPTPR